VKNHHHVIKEMHINT